MNKTNPVVIVGLGGCFPGAADPERYWDLITSAGGVAEKLPPSRTRIPIDDVFQAGEPRPDKVIGTHGCLVDHGSLRLDLDLLQIDAELFEELDPSFKLAAYAAGAAWRDARMDGVDRKRVGVVMGNIVLPTDHTSRFTRDLLGRALAEKLTGTRTTAEGGPLHPFDLRPGSMPAAVVSLALGLGGGAYTLDAACASSLFALKTAVDELHAGRLDAVLTGGLSRPDCLYTQMGFSQLRALSPTGFAAPFDAAANGLVVGEGAGIFVLKRAADALAAGDHIYAVVEGIGLSNDTDGSLLAPSSEGQLRAMRAAYRQADWAVDELDLIECHATGTPLGDKVEFQSLSQLWADRSRPDSRAVIGSVKGTVGHLLTAAGAASLMKVLLAMRAKTLPPTSHFKRPPEGFKLEDSPFRILQKPEVWERGNRPRRAAVSAFGFGGTNAHVLLSEWDPAVHVQDPAPLAKAKPARIAVVGLGAVIGPWANVAQLRSRLLGNAAPPEPVTGRTWGLSQADFVSGEPPPKGHFFNELGIPQAAFRIPPVELAEMLPQQLAFLLSAREALTDAGMSGVNGDRCGVFAGIDLDLNTTNYQLRWDLEKQAARWNRELGLDLGETELAAWVETLKDAAAPALNANRVLGGLGGLVGARVAREYRFGGPCMSLSGDEHSGLYGLHNAVRALRNEELDLALVGAVALTGDVRGLLYEEGLSSEGSISLVLKRLEDAEADGNTVYAVIDGLASGVNALETALEEAGDNPGSHLLEGDSFPEVDAEKSDVRDQLGRLGSVSGLASVLKAGLALHHHVLPATAAEGQPKLWLRDRSDGPRCVTVCLENPDGGCSTVILRGVDGGERPASPLSPLEETLIAVSAGSVAEMGAALADFEGWFQQQKDAPLHDIGRRWWKRASRDLPRRLVMVPASVAELGSLLGIARDAFASDDPEVGLRKAPPKKIFWRKEPLGSEAPVALVYPGSGSHFHGMGQRLSLRWPQALEAQDRRTLYLADELRPDLFWGERPDENLGRRHRVLLSAQVALGIALTKTAGLFGIHPNGVIGYSLGETAALFATDAWRDHDTIHLRTRESELFKSELAGPCHAVRRFWKLPEDEAVDWAVGVVNVSAEVVKQRLADEPRVYLLIINTPKECVIGGQGAALKAFVAKIGARFFPIAGVVAVHCEAASPVADQYREHHLFDTYPAEGVRYYSGAHGEAYEVTRDSAADSVLAQALEGVDFPATIEQAYADGFRIFVEIGPGASCTRMIRKILGKRTYYAGSICPGGPNPEGKFMRVLAALLAEGLSLDCSMLFPDEEPEQVQAYLKVALAGQPFEVVVPKAQKNIVVAAPKARPKPLEKPMNIVTETFTNQDMVQDGSNPDMPAKQASLMEGHTRAHQAYLSYAQQSQATMAEVLAQQQHLLGMMQQNAQADNSTGAAGEPVPQEGLPATNRTATPAGENQDTFFDRDMCLEFARGSLAKMLGPRFAEVDEFPTRVRLPDEPLMLVDRILEVGGEEMSSGYVVTEHDVLEDGWYLDGNRLATCIAIEAGQADLFLGAWLGVDFHTRGLSMYRLLDAKVTFHDELPQAGDVVRYDIYIERFFRQGNTHFFRFRFDGSVNGKPLLTMREGVAGFFSQHELDSGKGIIKARKDPGRASKSSDWVDFLPMERETYNRAQLDALRRGDLAGCFGSDFADLPLKRPYTLPGGLMELVDRVSELDPNGGEYGMGKIVAQMDIQPDDWFLTCHFIEDEVMPGTLMYECCLHTLRVFLMRQGWVGEAGEVVCHPVKGVSSKLLCRGQVLSHTRTVTYEVHIREMGYNPEPYCIADAYMYSDDKCIVDITDMCVRFAGLSLDKLKALWSGSKKNDTTPQNQDANQDSGLVMDYAGILALAEGNPSDFGDRYQPFDRDRKIARFPRPPFLFMSRVEETSARPWVLQDGVTASVAYDVPHDAWYFEADRQPVMPYAVLLEVALQSCGWMAAYMGCALLSPQRLLFRNLGGKGLQSLPIEPDIGTLTTRVNTTSVAKTSEQILLFFTFEVHGRHGLIYKGDTYFGFFTEEAMANQVGVADHQWYGPNEVELARGESFPFPDQAPYPAPQMRMLDEVSLYLPTGGKYGIGFIEGSLNVDPKLWFFEAHFYEDPVWPGSLGVEAFQQLLKVFAGRYFDVEEDAVFQSANLNARHSWIYRGQVIPSNRMVNVQANIKEIDEETRTVIADGYLMVDGMVIYQLDDFGISVF